MTTYLKRSVDDVIAWGSSEIDDPSQDWYNRCQRFCRMAYGVDIWGWDPVTGSNSAWGAWKQIPASKKVETSNPAKAERGSLIYYRGGDFGHVTIAIGKSTNDKCLSNDYMRRGKIDKAAPRDLPRWGLQVVGYSFWTPFGEMRPDQPKPLWDGVVPSEEGCFNAMNHGIANPQAYRIAARLYDLGMYAGTPKPEGVQKFPAKAVANMQASLRMPVNPLGAWSPDIAKAIFE